MFCSNCGNNCSDGFAFCTNCGSKLDVQPTPYTQPVQNVSETPAPKNTGRAIGIPAMILGIASIVNTNPVLAIVGIILSAISLSQSKKAKAKNTLAVVGLICSIIGLVVGIVAFIFVFFVYGSLYASILDEIFGGGSFSQF